MASHISTPSPRVRVCFHRSVFPLRDTQTFCSYNSTRRIQRGGPTARHSSSRSLTPNMVPYDFNGGHCSAFLGWGRILCSPGNPASLPRSSKACSTCPTLLRPQAPTSLSRPTFSNRSFSTSTLDRRQFLSSLCAWQQQINLHHLSPQHRKPSKQRRAWGMAFNCSALKDYEQFVTKHAPERLESRARSGEVVDMAK